MKKFVFKLRVLLSIRMNQEKEIRRQLSEIRDLIRQKQLDIEKTGTMIHKWSEHYNVALFKRLNPTELAMIDRHITDLTRFREQQWIALDILQRKLEDLNLQFTEIRKAVKTLEHVRDQKKAEYMEEFRKEEEKSADEMATLRFVRERLSL